MSDTETAAPAEAVVKADDNPTSPRGRGRPKKADSGGSAGTKVPGKRGRPKGAGSSEKKAAGTGKRGRPKLPESAKKAYVKKGKVGRPKSDKPSIPKEHPPVSEMVMEAVENLKNRKGCSLSAVKKYIAVNFKVDMTRQAIFIRRYVRKCIEGGTLSLVKGSSTTGSFKIADPSDKKVAKPKAKGTGKGRGRPKGSKGKPKGTSAKKPIKSGKKKTPGKRGRPKKIKEESS